MKYKILIALIGLSLLAGACSAGGQEAAATPEVIPTVLADNTITAEGRVEPLRDAQIAFSASGVVSKTLVEEGDQVKKGQPLIQLGDVTDSQYTAAQLELVTAQKALDDFLHASSADLAQAVIDLKQAKEDYRDADEYLNYLKNSKKVPRTERYLYYIKNQKGYQLRTRIKYFKGPAPEGWIIEAENDAGLKKAKLEQAQRTYDRMKGGSDEDQLKVLQAQLDSAEAGVAALSVVAPFDGVVTDLNAKTGSSINAGEIAVTIADFSTWLVKTTDLTEIDVVKLTEGQPVTVKLDALPDVNLKGEILSIAQNYSENQGDVVYEVTILLNETHPAMRWGMTANVAFSSED